MRSVQDERAARLVRAPFGALLVSCLAERVGCRHLDSLEPDQLYDIVVDTGIDLTPHAADYHDRVRELLARAPSLEYCARRLLEAPATVAWFNDLDKHHQIWISPNDSGEPPSHERFAADLRPFRSDVPKPRAAFWTCTGFGGATGAWMTYLQRGEDRRPPPYHSWRLSGAPNARVYEVHDPEAWRTLCLRFPLASPGGWVVPNWVKVAQSLDAVHLSVGGLLTAEGVLMGSLPSKTALIDWSVECTAWLRWAFEDSERLLVVE